MQPSSDSIQTLLRQRRQLRDCLQDLKTEIARLNTKAHSMTGVSFDGATLTADASAVQDITQSATVSERGEGEIDVMAEPSPAAPSPAEEKATKFKEVSREDLLSEPADQQPLLPERRKVELPKPDDAVDKPVPSMAKKQSASDEGASPSSSPISDIDLGQAAKPRPVSNGAAPEALIEQAILLAGFCLHHPSAAGNQLLNRLDAAIQQVKKMPEGSGQTEALDALKNAYRDVVERTYPTSKINGKTLVDSRQPNGLLWGIPMIIAALVLVVLPAFMLLQVLAGQLLQPQLSRDMVLIIGGLITFTWGIAGGLSYLTALIAAAIRRGSFNGQMTTGMGLQAMMGGLLGLISYTVFILLSSENDVTGDIANAMIAFGAGLLGGGITNLIISRKSAL